MAEQKQDGPHPRREPRFPGPLTLEGVEQIFEGCSDFAERTALLHNDPQRQVTLCYINGMVRGERINDYLLRPLAQDPRLSAVSEAEAFQLLGQGALYNLYVERRTTLDQAAVDLTMGWCVLFFPGRMDALSFFVGTEEKRAVGQSENEPALKGARDSFVESILTNTSLVRRRLRAPELKVRQHVVGRQSLTPAMVVYLDGIADPDTVKRVEEKLDAIDIDGVESAGNLEEYLTDASRTPFPLMPFTQRPDRFCAGLLEGRVGLLCDGLPFGYLLPGTMDQFFRTSQDRAFNWMTASMLLLLRYFCMAATLLIPGLYIALVTFHPEAIPVKLALSIVAAKQEVPFSTVFEVLIMLVAFEVLQEAGLRLPSAYRSYCVHPGRPGGGQRRGGGPHRLSGGAHRGGHCRGGGIHHAQPGHGGRPAAVALPAGHPGQPGGTVRPGDGLCGPDLPSGRAGELRRALFGAVYVRSRTGAGEP